MSATKTFHLFPCLPLELRQQIWCQALLAPAVWFATFPDVRTNAPREWITAVDRRTITMVPLGSVPSMAAGFACTESRREMESIITSPWKIGGQICWIHWENTVLHLGRYDSAIRLYRSLNEHERSRLRHVAFECPGWLRRETQWISDDLARGSRDLRTLIVHMKAISSLEDMREQVQSMETYVPSEPVPQLIPSARTASLYLRRSALDPARSEISEARVTSRPDQKGDWNRQGHKEIRKAFDRADCELYTPKVHFFHLDPARY